MSQAEQTEANRIARRIEALRAEENQLDYNTATLRAEQVQLNNSNATLRAEQLELNTSTTDLRVERLQLNNRTANLRAAEVRLTDSNATLRAEEVQLTNSNATLRAEQVQLDNSLIRFRDALTNSLNILADPGLLAITNGAGTNQNDLTVPGEVAPQIPVTATVAPQIPVADPAALLNALTIAADQNNEPEAVVRVAGPGPDDEVFIAADGTEYVPVGPAYQLPVDTSLANLSNESLDGLENEYHRVLAHSRLSVPDLAHQMLANGNLRQVGPADRDFIHFPDTDWRRVENLDNQVLVSHQTMEMADSILENRFYGLYFHTTEVVHGNNPVPEVTPRSLNARVWPSHSVAKNYVKAGSFYAATENWNVDYRMLELADEDIELMLTPIPELGPVVANRVRFDVGLSYGKFGLLFDLLRAYEDSFGYDAERFSCHLHGMHCARDDSVARKDSQFCPYEIPDYGLTTRTSSDGYVDLKVGWLRVSGATGKFFYCQDIWEVVSGIVADNSEFAGRRRYFNGSTANNAPGEVREDTVICQYSVLPDDVVGFLSSQHKFGERYTGFILSLYGYSPAASKYHVVTVFNVRVLCSCRRGFQVFMRDRLWQENRLNAVMVRRSPDVLRLMQRVSATIVHHYRFSRCGDNQMQTATDPPALFSLEQCTVVYYELCNSSFQGWLDMRERIRVAEQEYERGRQHMREQLQLAVRVPTEVDSDEDLDVVFSDDEVMDANDTDDWAAVVTEYIEGVHTEEFYEEHGLDHEYGVQEPEFFEGQEVSELGSQVQDENFENSDAGFGVEGPTADRHFAVDGVGYVLPGAQWGEHIPEPAVLPGEYLIEPNDGPFSEIDGSATQAPSSTGCISDHSISSEDTMYSFHGNNPFLAVVD